MDGIESTGAIPAPALPAALQHIGQMALSQKTAGVTLEEVARSSDEKKRQLAKDFESVLLTKLFDQVKESIGSTGFEEDAASDQVQGLFWSYLAQDIGSKGGFGLWEDIYEHFKDLEGQQASGQLMNKEL
jgi:Rod binding domain-containing protein